MREVELRKFKGKKVRVTFYNGCVSEGVLEKDKSWWRIGLGSWFHYADIASIKEI